MSVDQPDLFDLEAGRDGRDAGMDRVLDGEKDFKDLYFDFVNNLPSGWTGTSEDIRKAWPHQPPHHHNAWGACWCAAKKRGLLIELPDQVQMTSTKAHARKTHLYRRA